MTVRQAHEVVRFFRVVSPVPAILKAGIAVVTVVGAVVVLQAPSLAGHAFAPLLLLQMFAASSGFMVPARRGHYDLLLTQRSARVPVALVHWCASVAPGLAAWLCLGLLETAGRGGGRADLLASGTWCAIGIVSMLSWSAGAALPRFGGAISWLVLMAAAGSAPWLDSRRFAAATLLLDPGAIVGVALTRAEWLAVAPGLSVAVASMVVATAWIARADVALEAGQ